MLRWEIGKYRVVGKYGGPGVNKNVERVVEVCSERHRENILEVASLFRYTEQSEASAYRVADMLR